MRPKKKLLTIITKLEFGGAQQVALNTLRAVPKASYDCFLITGPGGPLDDEARQVDGVKVLFWKSFKHPIRPLADLMTLVRLIHFMKNQQIDIVHTHCSKAGLLGRLAAHLAKIKKIIHTIHGWPFHDYQPSWRKRLYIYLEQQAAAWCHHLIAVSEATKQKGLQHQIGREQDYQVIWPGSPLEQFGPGIVDDHHWLLEEFGFAGYPPVIGMISNLKPQKAPLDFIAVAQAVHHLLPAARFLLVGDGPLRSAVEAAIKKRSLSDIVKCTGWRYDIPDIMRGLTVMALTSLWEGLPCVFGQAMKTGLPIVATDVEGAREAIDHGVTGFLVPPRQPEKMADAIIEILTNGKLRIQVSKAAMKAAARFNLETMTQAVIAMYADSKELAAPSFDRR